MESHALIKFGFSPQYSILALQMSTHLTISVGGREESREGNEGGGVNL